MVGERRHRDISDRCVFVVGCLATTLSVAVAQGHHTASHNRTSGLFWILVPGTNLGTYQLDSSQDFGKEQVIVSWIADLNGFLVRSSAVLPADTFQHHEGLVRPRNRSAFTITSWFTYIKSYFFSRRLTCRPPRGIIHNYYFTKCLHHVPSPTRDSLDIPTRLPSRGRI
jgi:hypothetical protein